MCKLIEARSKLFPWRKYLKKFHTSSNSPSALTTVNVFLGVLSSKCGGEYPGALAGILGLEWSGLVLSLIKGLDSTSGDSNSALRSSIVLCSKRFRSLSDSSFDLWALSSTESRVMEDLEFEKKKIYVLWRWFFLSICKKKIRIQTNSKKVIFELSHFGH